MSIRHAAAGRCHYCGQWTAPTVLVDSSDAEYEPHGVCSRCFLGALNGNDMEPLLWAPVGYGPKREAWWDDPTQPLPPGKTEPMNDMLHAADTHQAFLDGWEAGLHGSFLGVSGAVGVPSDLKDAWASGEKLGNAHREAALAAASARAGLMPRRPGEGSAP